MKLVLVSRSSIVGALSAVSRLRTSSSFKTLLCSRYCSTFELL